MEINKWTIYIKTLRLASKKTIRSAAIELNVSAPYLQDVERGNRTPTKKLVNSIINLYNLGEEEKRKIYDAAAEVNDCIPYDVEEFLKNDKEAMQSVINMMNEKEKKKTLKY